MRPPFPPSFRRLTTLALAAVNPRHQPIVHHSSLSPPSWPATHTFPMSKFRLTASHLRTYHEPSLQGPLVLDDDDFTLVPSNTNPIPHIRRTHDPAYVDRLLTKTLADTEQNAIGFRHGLYESVLERTLLEVSATMLTFECALTHGLATSTSGGTHHAFRGRGSGFTMLNDVAVASQRVLEGEEAGRVLIIDLDVHQGDGTASFSADEGHYLHGKMFTLSVHCEENFPFEKGTSTYDVGLREGTGDDGYMDAVQRSVIKALDEVRPDLVAYIAGVDVWSGDKLGRLDVTMDGMRARDAFVVEEVVGRGLPLACVVGGGYEKDVERLAARHSMVSYEAAKVWRRREMYKEKKRHKQ